MIGIDCLIGGYIGWWRQLYWSALEHKEFYRWLVYVSQFSVCAITSCFLSGYSSYVINILALDSRSRLTRRAWRLDNHSMIEGGNQRVQEDCFTLPTLGFTLVATTVRSLIMIVVFAIILLTDLPYYYLIFPVVYAIVGTGLAAKIAHPLISLNYINQVFEAKFRHYLTKLNYKDVHRNNYNLFKITKYLQYFQTFYNQLTIIIPHIILFSLYFESRITFGVFMMVAASMVEIINNLSFLINSFSDINKLLSCHRRLKELEII